jgi:hypothetical protein
MAPRGGVLRLHASTSDPLYPARTTIAKEIPVLFDATSHPEYHRVRFSSMEDRLNPVPPEDADEGTLGGYRAVHGRSPTFEGSDGRAYSVAVETEQPEDGDGSWAAYLVFVRWADGGTAVMGHLDSADLAFGESQEEARSALETLRLHDVKAILDAELARRAEEGEV